MAVAHSFALFGTALGTCAIAWNDVGLTGVWLPEADAGALRRKVARRSPAAAETVPTGAAAGVVEAIARLLAGDPVDLGPVALDSTGIDAFDHRVYAVTRTIGAGSVLTYGDVAARVGADASARSVGQSLGRNAMPIVVPCHRVVASGGIGGFSAAGGAATKRRLLAIEDARPGGPPGLFDRTPQEDRDDDGGASDREARPRH
ncbi:MAG: methylated-DNA--[protein]-cysteine S-methyltransferase [Caldimonas sp.]